MFLHRFWTRTIFLTRNILKKNNEFAQKINCRGILFVLVAHNYINRCNISLEIFAYVGQALEFRCFTNETSSFTRIVHKLENGTIETLLSNDHFNAIFQKNEIHIVKFDHVYIIRINPVTYHSAGIYSCEDNISAKSHIHHVAKIIIHVLEKRKSIIFDNWKYAKVPYLPAYLKNSTNNRLIENSLLSQSYSIEITKLTLIKEYIFFIATRQKMNAFYFGLNRVLRENDKKRYRKNFEIEIHTNELAAMSIKKYI
ncbi:hypothetical protein BpHYR1_011464 [Brachionus plicatilis]|uniref:Uncharacterized protein n=1 Tax=Brachionus plicatilis TaxID=10195 RepID=A0A3M7QFG9_BRAPC|nr:hypothetical protein BpHYR1_011464 [Brachionus plicatilis]